MVLGLENVLNNSLHQLTLPEESLIVNVAILWCYNKAQLMYTCFMYYAKCIRD